MPNSPQENLTPLAGTDPEVTLAPDGSAVDGLVADVLRDARSLLGESAVGESNEEMDPDSAGDRPEMDAEEHLGDLERLSEDLVAEVEASATDPASGSGLQEGGIKRGPAARDLGTEGPQVDLFGMASGSEAPSSASRPPMASDQHGSDAAVPMNSDSADTNDEASSPAAALEALMASRIAEEFEADEPSTSTLDTSSCATVTSEITQAEAAERAAVASLDAMGGSTPLRSTAGEVEAVSSGDLHVRVDVDTTPTDSIAPALPGPVTPEAAPSDMMNDSDPGLESRRLTESTNTSTEATTEADSIDPPFEADSTMPVDAVPALSAVERPSIIARIMAMPFRLLPSSVHGLVSVTAISLVFWIPVAWTYAILGPEAFERLLPSATMKADPNESIAPASPAESPEVDSAGSDPPDPSPTP